MNAKFYKAVLRAMYGVPELERLPDSQVHVYLLKDTRVSIRACNARLRTSAEDQSQLCLYPHNHALLATPSLDQVVITRAAILAEHKSRTFLFK